MSSLLSLLGLGAAGLSAQHAGVAVASNNAANVNSPGYSRQRLDLRAEIGPPTLGGVRTGRPERWHDELLSRRERESDAGRAQAQAFAPAMLDLEARLDGGGPPLDRRLATLWAGLERVAAMPSDSLVRAAAIAAAADLAAGFRERAEAVAAARAEADTRIRDQATAVTTAAAELAELNRQHAISPDPVIADRRDQAGRKLAELVGGTGRIDGDGHVHWTLPDGAVLVDGTRSARLEATPDPVTGWHQLTVVDGNSRRDVTTSLTGGSLAGELAFRDGDGAAAAGALDQLAVDVATAWNNVHRAHAGTDGVSGRDAVRAADRHRRRRHPTSRSIPASPPTRPAWPPPPPAPARATTPAPWRCSGCAISGSPAAAPRPWATPRSTSSAGSADAAPRPRPRSTARP
jgi:flagellar hook-associated protein 1 FlgK